MGPQQLLASAGTTDAATANGQLSSLVNSLAGNPTDSVSRSTSPINGINFANSLRTSAGTLQSPAEAIGSMLSDDLMSSARMTADQTLRMIIALLILQMLLNQETGDSGSQANTMNALAAGLDALGQRNQPVQFSSTHIVQMQFQSTLVYTELSPTTSANGGEFTADQAPTLDVTA